MQNSETLAEIAAEMREECGDMIDTLYDTITLNKDTYCGFIGRIEAAAWEECATAEKSSAVGNAAALREALEYAIARAEEARAYLLRSADTKACMEELINECRAALSAPPRNCDVGTAEEQERRFRRYCVTEECNRYYCGLGCKSVCIDRCAVAWSQMPYKEGGEE